MNELRVRNLLLDRYNAKFFTIVHKISRPFSGTTCYSNNLACHPAAGDMRSALKIKIHNAINSAILVDSEDRGIFVGGRRRNRKKKRTKHVKTEKKKHKRSQGGKESTDMKNNSSKVEHQQLLEEDTKPLIESGFCDSIVSFGDFIDLDLGRDLDREEDEEEDIPPLVDSGLTLAPLVQYSYAVPNIVDYIEQVETDNMPLFKKKPPVSEEKQLQEKPNENQQQKTTDENNQGQTKEPETQTLNENEVKEELKTTQEKPEMTQEEVDSGTSSPAEDGKAMVISDEAKLKTTQDKPEGDEKQTLEEDGVSMQYQNDIDGVVIETEQKTTAVVTEQPAGQVQLNSKESSPLINKEDDLPCLCCTIL
ncbi:uncharacterized protein LOC128158886 isoform X2 [Crassostrea angulata]|uniref:uncharacterized protein LOC128158886 isoform X2 n=1 Tax=Magallana angulata TaxID=2784310 RepID=UPI0022B0A490|nr:uncharacterized protein LOC128158886 isoform X2 [Crassostrea angulata]